MEKYVINCISKIEKNIDGNIFIFPTTYEKQLFEFVYRTATGIRWNEEKKCFMKYEVSRWSDNEFIINTILSVKSEYGVLLELNDKTDVINLNRESVNTLAIDYFRFIVIPFENYPFVYVNNDGSVREVTIQERLYLQTIYSGSDGERPYIKNRYGQKNPENKIQGFCYRNRIPKRIEIERKALEVPVLLKDEIKRIMNMGYDIDYNGIEFIKLINREVSNT